MKKLILLFFFVFGFTSQIFSQITTFPGWENFDYTTGSLVALGAPTWSSISGTLNQVTVTAGNLTYTGYQESSIGNSVAITNSLSEDVKLSFTGITTTDVGSKRYVSFLIRVTNTTGLSATAGYFAILGSGTSVFANRIYSKLGSAADKFVLGLNKASAAPTLWSADLNLNQTYLIVLSQEIVSGVTNDIAKMWIDPAISGTEPAANFTVTTGTDNNIDGFILRQATGIPNATIDAIQVSTSWESAMPVELSTFTVKNSNNKVQLNWATSTEKNNYGFDVERSSDNNNFTKIAFIKGNGNSNSAKEYAYADNSVNAGKYQYRLKQIDNDGSFSYSSVVSVDVNNQPKNYSVSQNYPNPFNPSTKINYSLPYESRVTLTIYNVIGEVVSEMNKVQGAGNYDFNFNASNLKSGIYIYKLNAVSLDGKSSFTNTKKMTLVK